MINQRKQTEKGKQKAVTTYKKKKRKKLKIYALNNLGSPFSPQMRRVYTWIKQLRHPVGKKERSEILMSQGVQDLFENRNCARDSEDALLLVPIFICGLIEQLHEPGVVQ